MISSVSFKGFTRCPGVSLKVARALLAFNLCAFSVGTLVGLQAAWAQNPEITVYNQNFGLVKDYRTLSLQRGLTATQLDDVAALIDPTTVQLRATKANASFWVREQNFRYDLISKAAVLDKMVGQTIRFQKDGQLKSGILLTPATQTVPHSPFSTGHAWSSAQTQTGYEFAVKTDAGILLTSLNDIVVDSLPTTLSPRPTLAWLLESDTAGETPVELSYQTGGLNWQADYVATVDGPEQHLDLTAWVTVDNQSGAAYENANLKLVAGDVRRVNPPAAPSMDYAMAEAKSLGARAAQFQEESFFEYHLYSLAHPTTLRNRETKQIQLVQAQSVPVTKRYQFEPTGHVWLRGRYRAGAASGADKVQTILAFDNTEKHHLGMALPKGRIRVQKADSKGSLQFIGEDLIDHTPVDETLELYVGDAFDLVGERKELNYVQQGNHDERTVAVTLKNHKSSPVVIEVLEHPYGDWTIVESSVKPQKESATLVRFPVAVAPKGQTVLTYRLRTRR
ncbi:MAG: hypothetical protein SFZ03_10105 [Candidatus Melainabacteria bacterium]|nr:hypothetical protein [Candidatus Melainabacteria bacterium]